MEFALLYLAAALATGSVFVFDILNPMLEKRVLSNKVTDTPNLIRGVTFVTAALLAPAALAVYLVPSWNDTFREHFAKGLFE